MPTKNDPRPRRAATLCDPRLPERFWAKVSVDSDGCWIWTGYVKPNGYSQLAGGDREQYGHRIAYVALVGEIPDGMEIDHLCRVRRCVNPAHLEAVTHHENMRRRGLSVTHCKRGHEYTPENTYRQDHRRSCMTCRRTQRARAARAESFARLAADLAEMVAAA